MAPLSWLCFSRSRETIADSLLTRCLLAPCIYRDHCPHQEAIGILISHVHVEFGNSIAIRQCSKPSSTYTLPAGALDLVEESLNLLPQSRLLTSEGR